MLTNGIIWRTYKVSFAKPIEHELVLEFNMTELAPRSEEDLELLWLLAKEGWIKQGIGEYHTQRQALSRFSLAAVVLTDPVLEVLRRELRRISPGVKIDLEDLEKTLRLEVLKREVIEGEKAEAARRQVARAASRALRTSKAGIAPPEPVVASGQVETAAGAATEES
jgi:hypothetical protein